MRVAARAAVVFPVTLVLVAIAACGGGGSNVSVLLPDASDGAPVSVAPTEAGCSIKAAVDLTTLPTCCAEGHAHCLPSSSLEPGSSAFLSACGGDAGDSGGAAGYCVPDDVTKGGPYVHCTSLGDQPGACLSVCYPDVQANKGILPQSTCPPDARCAPCVDPLSGQTTGACLDLPSAGACIAPPSDAGPADAAPVCPHVGAPVVNVKTLRPCGAGGDAHCFPADQIPGDQASNLAPCEDDGGRSRDGSAGDASSNDASSSDGSVTDASTKDGSARDGSAGPSAYCVPDIFLTSGGQFILPSCASLGGGEGRCLSTAIPAVDAAKDSLPRSTCTAAERCLPCYDPVDGTDTGACHEGCDPGPKGVPYTFPPCCVENGERRGRCIPASELPPGQGGLKRDSCDSASECVPNEELKAGYVHPACTGFSLAYAASLGAYSGVCLSDCFDFSGASALAVSQGSCAQGFQCAPCKTPTGAATGAPDCPP